MNCDKQHTTNFFYVMQDLSALLATYSMLSELFYFTKYANEPESTMPQFVKVSRHALVNNIYFYFWA